MDYFKRMAKDLEKAQRQRFKKAGEKYEFFQNPVEGEILNQIHEFRTPRRRGPYRNRSCD